MPIMTTSTAGALLTNRIPRSKKMAKSGRKKPAMGNKKPMAGRKRKNNPSGRRK